MGTRHSNNKSYTDPKPKYDQHCIEIEGKTPEASFAAILPSDYIGSAESPLSVYLHHHMIDEDLFSDDLIEINLDTQFEIEIVDKLTITWLSPDSGAWGDTIEIMGAGFSESISDNTVYFTGDNSVPIAATVISASSIMLNVIVPRGSVSGDVWVEKGHFDEILRRNSLPFTVNQDNYTFVFGDNGSDNDDTFALYVNGKLVKTMPTPFRRVEATVTLEQGTHEIALHGITAPDSVGTYFIDFPENSTVSGDAITGNDLTAGQVKSWLVTVNSLPESDDKTPQRRGKNRTTQILWIV